jgi:hypothetical protein
MAIYHWTDICDYEGAKQCALIAVDEIQKIKSVYHDDTLYDYWEEVQTIAEEHE